MTSRRRADILIVAAFATLGAVVPTAAALHLRSRVDHDVAARLTAALGAPVAIDTLEAGATGELYVRGLRIGDFLTVERIAVLADIDSALAGQSRIAEIRVARPHLRLRADVAGRTELDELRAHFAHYRAQRSPARSSRAGREKPPLRLFVRGGDAVVQFADRGQLRVSQLSLMPRGQLYRAQASSALLKLRRGPTEIRGELHRLAADVDLRTATVPRVLVMNGSAHFRTDGHAPLRLVEVSALAGDDQVRPGWALELSANVDDERVDSHRPELTTSLRQRSAALSVIVSGDRAQPRIELSGTRVPLAALQAFLPSGMRSQDARFSGALAISARAHTAGSELAFTVDADIDQFGIDDRRVAQEAFQLSGHTRLRGHLRLRPETAASAGHVRIEDMSLSTGGLTIHGQMTADYDSTAQESWLPARARVELRVPRTACATALSAAPAPFRSRLLGLDMNGAISAQVEVAFTRAQKGDTQLDLQIADQCRVLRDAVAADPRALLVASEHRFPDGTRELVGPGQSGYARLANLPDHLIDGYVASEDARFFRHRGFDVAQIERSLAADLRAQAFVRGGSTISQQLVKNAFLSPARTLARKFQEAILTWRVESVVDKRQILERYLNIIELGPGIFGVEAAAQHWFGKPAAQLGVLESAFLVTLTPAPRTVSRRVRDAGRIDDTTRRRMDTVLKIMRRHRVIDERTYRRSLAEALTIPQQTLALNE